MEIIIYLKEEPQQCHSTEKNCLKQQIRLSLADKRAKASNLLRLASLAFRLSCLLKGLAWQQSEQSKQK